MEVLTTGSTTYSYNPHINHIIIIIFSFEASNGIKQQNTGFLKKVLIPQTREDGTPTGEKVEGDILVQTGSYSYTAPDGTVITITYVADENGFRKSFLSSNSDLLSILFSISILEPVGDHIPTPPAIPAQILDSLKKSAEEAQQQGGQPSNFQQPISSGAIEQVPENTV